VFELVRGFNAVLVEDSVILGCLHPRRMKDRALAPKEPYVPPPWRGLNPFTCSQAEFLEGLKRAGGRLASALVRGFNVSGEEAEEACFKAGLSKDLRVDEVGEAEASRLQACLKELREEALKGELKPCVVYVDGEPATALPFDFGSIEGRREYFESFNEALDRYFTWLRGKLEKEGREREAERLKQRLEEVVEQQRARMDELRREAAEKRRMAEAIMTHLTVAQRAGEAAAKAHMEGARGAKLVEDVKREVPEVVDVDPASRTVYVKLEELVVPINYSATAAQCASKLYEEAKEAERKAKRAEEALKQAAQQLLEAEREARQARPSLRERAWYEKFRWFYTSGGLLVIAGRDASQNERLVRRYLEEGDLFVHAEIHGAPAVILKQGAKAGMEDLKEAAQFAVAYSKAWREGRLQGDAYWAHPSQVSKTPPSGEYLPRGAFMVRGERNYVRSLPLEVAIGVDEEGRVVGGPHVRRVKEG